MEMLCCCGVLERKSRDVEKKKKVLTEQTRDSHACSGATTRNPGLLNIRNIEANKELAIKSQISAGKMEAMTKAMHLIAVKTKKETVSMRIITLVTLFFLPGTFISVSYLLLVHKFVSNSPFVMWFSSLANWAFTDNDEHGYHKISINSRVRKSISTWCSPNISRCYDSYDACSFCSLVVSLLVRQPETRYKGFWRHLFGVGSVILLLCDDLHNNQTSKMDAIQRSW